MVRRRPLLKVLTETGPLLALAVALALLVVGPASAQFFINVKNNSFLDYPGQDGWGYCVFGKVVEGMDVVDKIRAVKTSRTGMHADVPVEDVVVEKAEVV